MKYRFQIFPFNSYNCIKILLMLSCNCQKFRYKRELTDSFLKLPMYHQSCIFYKQSMHYFPGFFFNLFGNQMAPYKCHTETDRAFLTENFLLLFWCHNEAELKRQEGSSMIWVLFILVVLLTIYWTGVLCSEPLQAVSRQLADNSFLI